jgi:hypothetical protein
MSANGPHRTKPPSRRNRRRKLGGPPKDERWLWFTKSMVNSAAFQELIQHKGALRVVLRVVIEYLEHDGQDNGRLIVTYDNFEEFGISAPMIPESIDIAEALRFLIVHRGRKSKKDKRHPNRYGLTFYPIYEEFETNDWKRIQTRMEAEAIVERVKERRRAEAAKRRVSSPSIAPEVEGEEQDGAAEAVRTGT